MPSATERGEGARGSTERSHRRHGADSATALAALLDKQQRGAVDVAAAAGQLQAQVAALGQTLAALYHAGPASPLRAPAHAPAGYALGSLHASPPHARPPSPPHLAYPAAHAAAYAPAPRPHPAPAPYAAPPPLHAYAPAPPAPYPAPYPAPAAPPARARADAALALGGAGMGAGAGLALGLGGGGRGSGSPERTRLRRMVEELRRDRQALEDRLCSGDGMVGVCDSVCACCALCA